MQAGEGLGCFTSRRQPEVGKSGTGAAKGGEAKGHATVAGGGRGGVWHIAHTFHAQMAGITQMEPSFVHKFFNLVVKSVFEREMCLC
jgi:hypothetical protein